jgi:hypothetical protein
MTCAEITIYSTFSEIHVLTMSGRNGCPSRIITGIDRFQYFLAEQRLVLNDRPMVGTGP